MVRNKLSILAYQDAGRSQQERAALQVTGKLEVVGPSSEGGATGVAEGENASEKPASGFRARLNGATIADLVQLECLARSRGAVRVSSGSRVGYLFFDRGELQHAEVDDLVGEAAALDLLSLDAGEFDAIERPWPARPTIATSWQYLVLRSAQQRDEKRLQPPPPVERDVVGQVARKWTDSAILPVAARPTAMRSDALGIGTTLPPTGLTGPHTTVARTESGAANMDSDTSKSLGPNDLPSPLLRLDAEGNVLENRGTPEEFAGIIAYASRLAELIGEALGLEELRALECVYKDQRCIAFPSAGGEVTAVLTPLSTDVAGLKRTLRI